MKNGYLEKGSPSAWCGIAGLGKSRLVMQFSIDTILGRDFIGLETNGDALRWLIIQNENGNRRLKDDLCAMFARLTKGERDNPSARSRRITWIVNVPAKWTHYIQLNADRA